MDSLFVLLCLLCFDGDAVERQSSPSAVIQSNTASSMGDIERMFALRFVLLNSVVSRELGLTVEQQRIAKEISVEWLIKYKKLKSNGQAKMTERSSAKPLSSSMADADRKRAAEITLAAENALERLLAKEQRKRFRELAIQSCGVKALGDKDFVEQLGLLEQQKQQIDLLFMFASIRAKALVDQLNGKKMTVVEFKNRSSLATRVLETAIYELLDTKQLAFWDSQKGAPAAFNLNKLEYRIEIPPSTIDLPDIPASLIPSEETP